jgi:hypothetical protein
MPELQSLDKANLMSLLRERTVDIIRIQAMWRGYRTRLVTSMILREIQSSVKKKYFLDEEF